MRIVLGALLGALLYMVLASIRAEASDAGEYAIPFTTVKHLKAKSNGVDYALYIRTPPDYARSGKHFPVMIMLDADYSFSIAVNQQERLASHGQSPEMILVAIAYPGVYPDVDGYRMNRTRDYTPSRVDKCCYGPKFQKFSGGGPKFRDFIVNELIPYLDNTYRTDPADRIYVGHSFGGLFGGYMLLTAPDVFSRYILVSGSYWYDDDLVKKLAAGAWGKPSKDTRVYLGVGSWENQPRFHMMIDDQTDFARLLEQNGGAHLHVETRVFDDETHASIFPAAFSTGLRHLYYKEF